MNMKGSAANTVCGLWTYNSKNKSAVTLGDNRTTCCTTLTKLQWSGELKESRFSLKDKFENQNLNCLVPHNYYRSVFCVVVDYFVFSLFVTLHLLLRVTVFLRVHHVLLCTDILSWWINWGKCFYRLSEHQQKPQWNMRQEIWLNVRNKSKQCESRGAES